MEDTHDVFRKRRLRRAETLPVRFASEESVHSAERSLPDEIHEAPGIFSQPTSLFSEKPHYPDRSYPVGANERPYYMNRKPAKHYGAQYFPRKKSASREKNARLSDSDEGGYHGSRSKFRSTDLELESSTDDDIDSRDWGGHDGPMRRSSRTRSRARRREPIIINNRISSINSDSDVDFTNDAYSFNLSRHTRSVPSQDGIVGSISDVSEQEYTNSDLQAKAAGPQFGKTLQVLSSQYTGDGNIGGFQTAQLTIAHDLNQSSRKGPSPIFRWIHFEDPHLSFDEFQNGISQISGLSDMERKGISKLLGHVRKRYDKATQTLNGSKARFLVPSLMQETLPHDTGPKTSRSRPITWMCMPYFTLQAYSGSPKNIRLSSHPIRTLLQARFSLVKKDRDLQQAVCNLPGNPPDHCFHISQLWCIVIDDSLLITCGRTPLSALCGESISTISETPTGDAASRSPNLLVSCGNSLLWSFQLDECKTWFAFMLHFWEYWPRRIEILHDGKAITPEEWPRLIATARKIKVRLSLQFGGSVKELAKGVLIGSDEPHSDRGVGQSSSNVAHKESKSTEDKKDPHLGSIDQLTPGLTNLSSQTGGYTSHPVVKDNEQTKETADGEKEHGPGKHLPQKSVDKSDEFHVFTWLATSSTSVDNSFEDPSVIRPGISVKEPRETGVDVSSNFSEKELREDLEEMNQFLTDKISFRERLAYQKCPQRKRGEVFNMLVREREDVAGLALKDPKRRVAYETMVGILNSAELLFKFFLPSRFDGPTVPKYWGATYRLLAPMSVNISRDETWEPENPLDMGRNMRSRRRTQQEASEVLDWLESIARHTQHFKELFSRAGSSNQLGIKLPEEFPRAWLHLVMAFILSAEDMSLFNDQIMNCSEVLSRGMIKVVRDIGQKSLLESSVFMPFELISLVNFQLLQDVTGAYPDISETYWSYLTCLESEIEANPLDRAHQNKIVLLKQEISVIRETLVQQRRILDRVETSSRGYSTSRFLTSERRGVYEFDEPRTLRLDNNDEDRYTSRGDDIKISRGYQPIVINNLTVPASQLSPTDPSGFRGLLTQDSLALIEKRIREFKEINDRASDLETWNIQKIDSNKDRQEAAIYAFTIVTIIFLPMSAVASILGMNTNDIRNMEVNQWVFWAVAVPLTTVIITLCLMWAGEFQSNWSLVRGLWSRGSRKPSRYQLTPDNYGMDGTRLEIAQTRRVEGLPLHSDRGRYYKDDRGIGTRDYYV